MTTKRDEFVKLLDDMICLEQQSCDASHTGKPYGHLRVEFHEARAAVLAAYEEAAGREGEAVAWRHVMHMEGGQFMVRTTPNKHNPWGIQGKDFDSSYTVTSEPLFTHPAPKADEPKMVAACCGRSECGGECGNEWRGMEP